jgi:peptide/nickel transport system permease protein
LLAGVLSPFDPLKGNFRARMAAPSSTYWMGTDHFGRDILSRILHGARVSLQIGFAVALVTGLLGVIIGAASGYFRRLDGPIMRLMDAFMAFPSIILAIAISSVLGASVTNVIIALSIAATPHTARIVRASVIVVREMEYVEAARALGASHMRILMRHILANSLAPLVVRMTYVFAVAILNEAVLSYIGVGPPPPTPTFGAIIANGRDFIVAAPWITMAPGLTVLVCVLGLNLLGDGLRDVLDPRMRVAAR